MAADVEPVIGFSKGVDEILGLYSRWASFNSYRVQAGASQTHRCNRNCMLCTVTLNMTETVCCV